MLNSPIAKIRLSKDGNESGKKPIGLDWQNNNFARASRFFVHLSTVLTRLQRQSSGGATDRYTMTAQWKCYL